MHHAHSEGGSGWCMFSDLVLALRKLRKATDGAINNVMIVDTDVHQVWWPNNMHNRQSAWLSAYIASSQQLCAVELS